MSGGIGLYWVKCASALFGRCEHYSLSALSKPPAADDAHSHTTIVAPSCLDTIVYGSPRPTSDPIASGRLLNINFMTTPTIRQLLASWLWWSNPTGICHPPDLTTDHDASLLFVILSLSLSLTLPFCQFVLLHSLALFGFHFVYWNCALKSILYWQNEDNRIFPRLPCLFYKSSPYVSL